ncbi:MAG: ureidoglycolate lyase [Phycisphaerae bacterium]
MKNLAVQDLSLEGFSEYGSFANMVNPQKFHFGGEPIAFFRDMLQLELGSSSRASFSVCRVKQRPKMIETAEYHSSCGEGILPLDADVLIHVAHATKNGVVPEEYEVFRVPQGTMVTLRPGVWHHAPFAESADTAHTLIVLPERTYANDCVVYTLDESEKTQIG